MKNPSGFAPPGRSGFVEVVRWQEDAEEKPERVARALSWNGGMGYFAARAARSRLERLPPLLPTFSFGPMCLSV